MGRLEYSIRDRKRPGKVAERNSFELSPPYHLRHSSPLWLTKVKEKGGKSQNLMVPELEKPRVTELQLRMDCNGCIQKIKKALHSIDGVYDIYIDIPQQKLTVVGRAELDTILKAIKKTKKIATLCSHTDPNAPPPAEPPAPPAAEANPPPAEAPAAKPEEPPKDPPPAPAQETQATEAKPSVEEPKVVEEVHMVHHYPNSYYRYHSQHEAPRYGCHWSPTPNYRYSWMEAYDGDYYQSRERGDSNKMSIFSEENPNNCTIM